jgi:hypothetical protein
VILVDEVGGQDVGYVLPPLPGAIDNRVGHAAVLGHVNRRDLLKDLLLTHVGTDRLINQVHHPPTSTSADGRGSPASPMGTGI